MADAGSDPAWSVTTPSGRVIEGHAILDQDEAQDALQLNEFNAASPLGLFEDASAAAWQVVIDPAPAGDVGWVASPEELVFGHSSGESSPSHSMHSSSPLDDTLQSVDEMEEKRKKNAEAAARYRQKKRAKEQSAEKTQAEFQQNQRKLEAENYSLRALNKSLEEQLSFFQNLFRTTMQHSSASALPSIHDAAQQPPAGGCDDDALDLGGSNCSRLPCGSKRKNLVCQAVVLLAVLSVGSEDVLKCSDEKFSLQGADSFGGNFHHHGRALLWMEEGDEGMGVDTHAAQCSNRSRISMLGMILQSPSPFSSGVTAASITVLRTCAALWLTCLAVRLLCSERCALTAPPQRWHQHILQGRLHKSSLCVGKSLARVYRSVLFRSAVLPRAKCCVKSHSH